MQSFLRSWLPVNWQKQKRKRIIRNSNPSFNFFFTGQLIPPENCLVEVIFTYSKCNFDLCLELQGTVKKIVKILETSSFPSSRQLVSLLIPPSTPSSSSATHSSLHSSAHASLGPPSHTVSSFSLKKKRASGKSEGRITSISPFWNTLSPHPISPQHQLEGKEKPNKSTPPHDSSLSLSNPTIQFADTITSSSVTTSKPSRATEGPLGTLKRAISPSPSHKRTIKARIGRPSDVTTPEITGHLEDPSDYFTPHPSQTHFSPFPSPASPPSLLPPNFSPTDVASSNPGSISFRRPTEPIPPPDFFLFSSPFNPPLSQSPLPQIEETGGPAVTLTFEVADEYSLSLQLARIQASLRSVVTPKSILR